VTAAIFGLTAFVAAMNGGNDVSKGVATLAGAGVSRYRTAIVWGTVTTLGGCLLSLTVATKLTALFSKGIVSHPPTNTFTLAVLVGTGAWVALATVTRLPVSTTQAIIGALVGAGLVLGADSVHWAALPEKIVLPTVLAIVVAYGISWLLSLIPDRMPECICVRAPAPADEPVVTSSGALAFTRGPNPESARLETGTLEECRVHGRAGLRVRVMVNGLHWLSSGATGFARGLNDAPKIVAVGAFTLVPAGFSSHQVLFLVAGAMALGSLIAGGRVARRLGEDVVKMTHAEGAKANLTTAVLVGLSAGQGVPLSTTQVSASAIAGAAGTHPSRINARTIRDFVVAWTVTPVAAALVAAAVYALA
jgi:inorganic phosphate transporter, PiT family